MINHPEHLLIWLVVDALVLIIIVGIGVAFCLYAVFKDDKRVKKLRTMVNVKDIIVKDVQYSGRGYRI